MNRHTPGPWRVNASLIEGPQMALTVASVSYPELGHAPKDKAEHKANARLIAAAPDLLDALLMALPYVECAIADPCYKPGAVRKIVEQMSSAIAKAEGK